jgi:hypothetical protein
VSLTEESVAAEIALPPPTTQSTELKLAVQHIDASISYIAQYDEHQAASLRFLRAALYTTMKRKSQDCTDPLQDLVGRFDGDLVAAGTMQERLEEHGSKEDIKLQKQIVENIERRKGAMEKLGEVLKGPELVGVEGIEGSEYRCRIREWSDCERQGNGTSVSVVYSYFHVGREFTRQVI